MAARKDKRKGWVVDFVFRHASGRVERVRRRCPVQTRRGAEDYERQLRHEMLNPRAERKEAPVFEAFAEEFFSGYVVANNKHAERLSKRSILDHHLIPAFRKRRLSEIGLREVERYKADKVREGMSAKSINNHLTVLRRLLATAAEWDRLGSVPPIKWMKAPSPEFDFLAFEEAEQLVAAADAGLWRTMVLVGLRTGLRQGELLALRWEDVDLGAGRVVVRRNLSKGVIGTPKSGRTREVPLSSEALAALKAHRHLRGPLVFCREGGRMLTPTECKWPLWRACRRAGLRRVGWHVARHTFASHLVMRGVPLKVVQELLGHATIEMTMRYAHLSPEVGREAVQVLDGRGIYVAPPATAACKEADGKAC